METVRQIQQQLLILAGGEHPTLILGLSGGADSVVLFHAMQDLHQREKINLHCVHINHGWRETAGRDQTFCEELCKRHNIPLTVSHAADWIDKVAPHKRAHASRESLGREIRRLVFEGTSARHQAQGIVLAHHADDQLETFLVRLIRGTSLTGLCCMHPRAGSYIRPLLSFTKAHILAAIEEGKMSFCHDESNDSPQHLRNRIRATALPALLTCDSRAVGSMHSTIARLQDDDEFLEQVAQDIFTSLTDERGWLPREQFSLLHRALQVRLLLILLITSNVPFTPSTRFFDELRRFLASPAGAKHAVSPTHDLQKKHGWFGITPK
jgi:tRNA(Ile)-lysidine synthase